MRWQNSNNPPISSFSGYAWRRLLIVFLLGGACLSATCENQDYGQKTLLLIEEGSHGSAVAIALSHPYRGLNSVDYLVTNTGEDATVFGVGVILCKSCQFDEDCPDDSCNTEASFCNDAIGDTSSGCCTGNSGDCETPTAFHQTPLLVQDETFLGRFHEDDLGLGDHVQVEFHCLGECQNDGDCPDQGDRCIDGSCESSSGSSAPLSCTGQLEFVPILRQMDCRDDTDCNSDETCDLELGFCRVEAEVEAGCQVISSPVKTTSLFHCAILLALVLCVFNRNKRKT